MLLHLCLSSFHLQGASQVTRTLGLVAVMWKGSRPSCARGMFYVSHIHCGLAFAKPQQSAVCLQKGQEESCMCSIASWLVAHLQVDFVSCCACKGLKLVLVSAGI